MVHDPAAAAEFTETPLSKHGIEFSAAPFRLRLLARTERKQREKRPFSHVSADSTLVFNDLGHTRSPSFEVLPLGLLLRGDYDILFTKVHEFQAV